MIPACQVIIGDCREELAKLPEKSVHLCVTSPPYYGLRDYGVIGQIGQEKSIQAYMDSMLAVCAGIHRVLRNDGNFYLNLGDSYASAWPCARRSTVGAGSLPNGKREARPSRMPDGLKEKDLIGIPWRVALALQSHGWWLREDIIWYKANCMPESVTDRCTRSHEYIFHFTKSAHYYYDQEAIKEPCIYDVDGTGTAARKARAHEGDKGFSTAERNGMRNGKLKDAKNFDRKHKATSPRGHPRAQTNLWDDRRRHDQCVGMRNKRDVWSVAPANYPEAHFATFPPKLIEPCVLAGCPMGGTVLDPFGGSGTTAEVAMKHGRNAILIELNPAYGKLINDRIAKNGGQGVMQL